MYTYLHNKRYIYLPYMSCALQCWELHGCNISPNAPRTRHNYRRYQLDRIRDEGVWQIESSCVIDTSTDATTRNADPGAPSWTTKRLQPSSTPCEEPSSSHLICASSSPPSTSCLLFCLKVFLYERKEGLERGGREQGGLTLMASTSRCHVDE